MIKKIVFFITSPLSLRDYNRFGANVFLKNGYEVSFFDFSPFINRLLYKNSFITQEKVNFDNYYYFNNEKDAVSAILKLNRECFIFMMERYYRHTFKIYRALSMSKLLYAVTVSNALPTIGPSYSRIKYLLMKARYLLTLPEISRLMINLPFRVAFSKFLGIKEPTFCIAGGCRSPKNYITHYPFGRTTEILWAHSLDYDIYLEKHKLEPFNYSDKAVFLDEGAALCIGDGGNPYISKEKYYPALCRFFDKIENELRIKVEIAAHPRAKHSERPEYFGKRFISHGNTIKMIGESKLIIAHSSTAVNFAILFKKPVIFIVTDEHEQKGGFNLHFIRSMAASLSKKPINIDHEYNLNWEKELTVDKASYAAYKNNFIKKEGTQDVNSWQIFCNRLKSLNTWQE